MRTLIWNILQKSLGARRLTRLGLALYRRHGRQATAMEQYRLYQELLCNLKDRPRLRWMPYRSAELAIHCGRVLAEHGSGIKGARILDLGAGHLNPLGLGLALLAAGADSVTALEPRQPDQEAALFSLARQVEALALNPSRFCGQKITRAQAFANLEPKAALCLLADDEPLDVFLAASQGLELALKGLPGSGLEPGSYDLIHSRSVLEHIPNLPGALYEMASLLKPGGLAFHSVDFTSHEKGANGPDYWGFLQRPSEDSCQVNRIRHGQMLKMIEQAGFSVIAAEVTNRLDITPRIKASLQPEFRELSDEELCIAGARFTLTLA